MKQYFKKVIVIYSLVLGLLEAPAPIVAPFLAAFVSGSIFADSDEATTALAPSTTTQSLESMLGYYQGLSAKSDSKSIIDGQGKGVLEDTQKFMLDPSNAAALATDNGKQLLAYHNKFLNYFETKEKLEKCMEEIADGFLWGGEDKIARYGRDLDQRVLGGLLETDVSGFNCHNAIVNKTDFDDLYNTTMRATEGIKLNSLEETVFKNSFEKVTKAWLKTKYSYDKDFAPGNNLTDDEKKAMADSLCEDGVCSDTQKAIIDEVTPDFMQLLSSSELQRFSSEEASADVTAKINELNTLTSTLTMDARRAIWKFGAHTLDKEGDGTKTAINQYQNTYLQLSSTGAGSLMWTEAMQNASGAMKDLKDWDWTGNGNDIRITPHRGVNKEDMDRAIAEVLGRVSDQAKTINEFERKREKDKDETQTPGIIFSQKQSDSTFTENREEALKKYVEMSPSVVGQSLAAHPENVQGVCNAIDSIIREERNSVWLDNATMVVTVAAGVALVASGFGAGAGASLLTLAVAGLAIGAADSGYTYVRMGQERQEYQAFLNSYYGGLGDNYTLLEAKAALEDFESAESNFHYALGFMAVDILTLGASRVGRNLSPDRLTKVANFYKTITNNMVGRNLIRLMRGFSAAKREAYRVILEKIALSDTSGKMLEMLNKLSFGSLDRLLVRFYDAKTLCRGPNCPALDEAISSFHNVAEGSTTMNLSQAQIDEFMNPILIKYADNNPALGDAITSAPSMGAVDGANLGRFDPPSVTSAPRDLVPSPSASPRPAAPGLPDAPVGGRDLPVIPGVDDAAARALALREGRMAAASDGVARSRALDQAETLGRGTMAEAEAVSRANALRIAREQDALRVADELAEAQRLARAIDAERAAVGVSEAERFSRVGRIANANADLAEQARVAKAAEAARAARESEDAARIANLQAEAAAAARVAEDAARVADEARAAEGLVELERFRRIERLQGENSRIINQVRAAKEAEAARAASDLAAATRAADVAEEMAAPYRAAAAKATRDEAAERAARNSAAESDLRGLPRDRSVVVARNILPEAVDSADAARRALVVADDMAAPYRAAAARERAARNAAAETDLRGLPRDRSLTVRGETAPVVRGAVEDSRDVTRALDGEILGPEIARRGPEPRRIEADAIEGTAVDLTPVRAAAAIEGPAPALRLTSDAAVAAARVAPDVATAAARVTPEVAVSGLRAFGRTAADVFRDLVGRVGRIGRMAPSAGRLVTRVGDAGAGDASVVVAAEDVEISPEGAPETAVQPTTDTTEPVTDRDGNQSCDEEGFELVEVEGQDEKVCERVSCDEGFEVNEDKDGCNIICEEGLVPNADQSACGTQGFMPQGINMIRRGIRNLGGLW